MNYTETVEFLYAQLPMFSRIGAAAYKNNLDNTIALCQYLNNPQEKFKSIHVAGTNGKGSTCHMLSAILQEAGYKVGLYTSPHLLSFTERIKINGIEIEEVWVIDFVEKIKSQIAILKPSFFEITVAMAFSYFAAQQVDVAIIEVGMGGRLDSTNIIKPMVCAITNISKDHTQFLGNSIEEIAGEKAGIIKPNVPVVIGEVNELTEKIFFNKAHQLQAPIYFAEVLYDTIVTKINNQKVYKLVNKSTLDILPITLDLEGDYQQKNIKTVFTIIEVLKQLDFKIENKHCDIALKKVKILTGLFGRYEIVQHHPKIIFDVSHNEAGIALLMNQIRQEKCNHLHIVLGFVKDKDIDSVLSYFPTTATYYFTNAAIPRALPSNELKQKASLYHLNGEAFFSSVQAYQKAKSMATPADIILVCGSFFVVSELM